MRKEVIFPKINRKKLDQKQQKISQRFIGKTSEYNRVKLKIFNEIFKTVISTHTHTDTKKRKLWSTANHTAHSKDLGYDNLIDIQNTHTHTLFLFFFRLQISQTSVLEHDPEKMSFFVLVIHCSIAFSKIPSWNVSVGSTYRLNKAKFSSYST